MPLFLQQSPINNYGLPIGNYLGWVLTGLYLLSLDFKIPNPFLRIQDDYLIFCKNKKEPDKILKEIIQPELKKLELNLNLKKLNSGKFHQNPVEFMGFKYYAGIFTISEKKIEEFKKRIEKITHLINKRSIPATIKLLNNKILGFGHYYKFTYSKQIYKKLDAFIRQRLRTYISRNKDSKNKSGNLILTNQTLESMKLKSLISIYNKYASKKKHILRKNKKNTIRTCKFNKQNNLLQNKLISDEYWKKAVLNYLKEIIKNIKQIKKYYEYILQKWKMSIITSKH